MTSPEPAHPQGAAPAKRTWAWPRWERDEILREQVALLRHNFPMTLLASLATALGTQWVMYPVADRQAMLGWLVSHMLVVGCVYAVLLGIDRQGSATPDVPCGA